MKISVFLLIIGISQAFGTGLYSQSARISINLKNVSVEEVLNEIEAKSDFYFFFNQKLIDVERTVDVVAENETIQDILAGLFSKTDVEYVIYDRQIILAPKAAVADLKERQQARVTGIIKDAATGEPLVGVYIQIENTARGTTSGIDGSYSVEIPGPGATLVFSYVGYITEKVVIAGQTVVDINMVTDVKSLEEVVVIGYGVQKKKDLTGSVGVVDVDEMKKLKVAGVGEALQGQIAGVSVQTNGDPGRMADVRIRGIGSFSNVGPLYVIDGEIEMFYSSEARWWPQVPDTYMQQEIHMIRSTDNGITWSFPITVAWYPGKRDGMPVPLLLSGNRGVVFVIETVNSGTSPYIVERGLSEPWTLATSNFENGTHRWLAGYFNGHGGAPYLVQLPTGETVLSVHVYRGGDWHQNNYMQVMIGDRDARNFGKLSTPWGILPVNESAVNNSLFIRNTHSIMAVSGRNFPDGSGGIYWLEGTIETIDQ